MKSVVNTFTVSSRHPEIKSYVFLWNKISYGSMYKKFNWITISLWIYSAVSRDSSNEKIESFNVCVMSNSGLSFNPFKMLNLIKEFLNFYLILLAYSNFDSLFFT